MATEQHTQEAEHTLDLVLCNGPEVPDYRAEAIKTIANALASARQEGVREGMKRGFLAGFNASGEGWNGEYPFGDRGIDPETDENFIAARDFALSNIDEANQ